MADQAGVAQRSWREKLTTYQTPSLPRSVLEIVLTVAPLAVIWAGAWAAALYGLWWLALLLCVPAAGFLVRLFLVQHDCGHHAFFKNASANDWVGRAIGVLTLTPHDNWRRTHALHHATSGNLDRRGVGDVTTLTVDEFRALPFSRRLAYRAYRHPLVLFVLGPAYLFFLRHRLPEALTREGWKPWLSAMGSNAVIAALIAAAIWAGGWKALLLVHAPTMLLAASIGVWLFYVQHQFEHTSWARQGSWSQSEAALHGSSYYALPAPLRWLTANVGVHHVHHVSSRIPFYRLPKVLRDHPELQKIGRVTFGDSIRSVALSLWDETNRRLVSFREVRRQSRQR